MAEYNTFLLWLKDENGPSEESLQPKSTTAASHHVSQPVMNLLSSLSIPTVPTRGFSHVLLANYSACPAWADLQPCIFISASSLESHERVEVVELISQVISRDTDVSVDTL